MEFTLNPREQMQLGQVSRLLKKGETAEQIIKSTRIAPEKVYFYTQICEEARKRKNERLELESQTGD